MDIIQQDTTRNISRNYYSNPQEFYYVNELSDLPTPVNGVITLLAETTYYFTDEIDLLGNRLVASQDTVILGSSSENSSITSTGLSASEFLLYSDLQCLLDISQTSLEFT